MSANLAHRHVEQSTVLGVTTPAPAGNGTGSHWLWRKPQKRRLAAAWREIALNRIDEAEVELKCVSKENHDAYHERVSDAKKRLKTAREIVECSPSLRAAWSGVDVERAWENIHAVEVSLIRLYDSAKIKATIPYILADAWPALRPGDALFTTLDEYRIKTEWEANDYESVAQYVRTIYARSTNQYVRARSFRNILFSATFVLTLFAVGFGILGAKQPDISMSASTQCPPSTGLSLWLVELLGLFGASLIGSVAIRRMRGTSSPYAVPMASLLVKLPSGALTAAGGLMLIRAGFLNPNLAPCTTAQLVAYALIFGASQQTFTRLIDRQAQNVLNAIPSIDHNAAED